MINVLYPYGYMTFPDHAGYKEVLMTGTMIHNLGAYIGNSIMVFEGGGDVSPKLYGEENQHSYGISTNRDMWEQACYETAKEFNIPVIGICRGHQLIAALEGGALYQDIGRQVGMGHSSRHQIKYTEFAKECDFFDLMQSCPTGSPYVVNSLHHQAVKRLPGNAKLLAVNERDGVVEALWYPHGITVQWHPEFLGHVEFLDYMVKRFNLGVNRDHSTENIWSRDRVHAPAR
jgi:putative glutamine amidotransferase